MARHQQTYFPVRSFLLSTSEALLATLALVFAMFLYLGPLNAALALEYERASYRVGLIVLLFVQCMYYFDLYDLTVLRNPREVITNLIQCFGSFFVVLAGIYALYPEARLQENVVLVGTGLTAAGALAWRQLFRHASHWPVFQERLLILGEGPAASELTTLLASHPELGRRVVCQIHERSEDDPPRKISVEEELRELVESQDVQRVVVSLGEQRGRLPVDALLHLKEHGVAVQEGSDLYENITGKIHLGSLRPSMLLFSPAFEVPAVSYFGQRVLALLISAPALLLTSPLLLLIGVAIKLESHGPAVFRQKRIGYRGKPFMLYKFRSMLDGSDGVRPADKEDERVTRVGRWLRSTRLDELPQLWNVLRGDMHLVGPRPFVPEQEESLVRTIPFYKLRWSVRPGATGWAQVNRGYCSTDEDNAEKLAFDLFYIKHFSLGLDLLILFKTVKILLLGRGAQ